MIRHFLADEPTGNLDDESAQTIMALMALLHRSCRDRGKTLTLVTHDRHTPYIRLTSCSRFVPER